MRVIFLDFDGVLNSIQSRHYHRHLSGPPTTLLFRDIWCPIATSNLRLIAEKLPDVHFIISSSWRHGRTLDKLRDILEPFGVPRVRVDGTTPYSSPKGNERGHQIQEWLTSHPEVTEFVIIDDDSDMVHLRDRLVHTTWLHGLQFGDVLQVFRLFGRADLAMGDFVE